MKNIFKIISEKPIIKWLANKYVLIFIFFAVWMVFLDNYSLIEHHVLNKQIDDLEDNKTYYQGEINTDVKKIKELKNLDNVEKYAREKYFMKKDSEDIFIVEYESDSVE